MKVLEQDRAYAAALKACKALKAGNKALALKWSSQAASLTPEGWPFLIRSQIKMKMGQEDLAIADVTRAFDRSIDSGWVFDLALSENAVPQSPLAQELLRQAASFKRDKKAYPVYAFIGKLKAVEGRLEEGLKDLNKAIQARPSQAYLWAWRAEIYRRSGNLKAALRDVRRALALDAKEPVARVCEAAILRLQGKPKEARQSALLAVKQAPAYEAGYLEAARACLALKDAKGTLNWLERAVKCAARYGWRNLYENQGVRFEDFEIFKNDPYFKNTQEYGRLLAWQGEALLGVGRTRQAFEILKRAVKLAPKFGFAYAWLAEALENLSQNQEALDELNKALRLSPRYARALGVRGRLSLKLNQGERALRDLDAALALDGTWAWIFYWRACALASTGNLLKAASDIQRALNLDPRFADAQRLKEQLALLLGR